jgi:hypothetical protein
MREFSEETLQYMWSHKLIGAGPFSSTSGNSIEILRAGEKNAHAGPDFFNALVRVNGTSLAGNVEIHRKTSDWVKHKHQYDRAYDRLILHVVYEHDVELEQNMSHGVDVLELKHIVGKSALDKYEKLNKSTHKLPCGAQLPGIAKSLFTSWLNQMVSERLEDKILRVKNLFTSCSGDYSQTFYTLLLRNFGLPVNALPFEMLAQALPFRLLLRHADNLFQLNALLLGAGGLLEEESAIIGLPALRKEYSFLSSKYNLKPLPTEAIKRARMRPGNAPALRLSQFASLLHKEQRLFIHPETFTDQVALRRALDFEASHHPSIGEQFRENLLVNSFAPFFLFYAALNGEQSFKDIAMNILAGCAPEKNSKTSLFVSQSGCINNALHSQGLIHLHDHYCIKKRCLDCAIGRKLVSIEST